MPEKGKFSDPKKDYSALEEDQYVKKWLGNVKSKQQRLSALNEFCEFTEKTPEELILEHHEDKKLEPINQTEIAKNQLKAFYNYIIGEKNTLNNKVREKFISINSGRQYVYSKIASFYKRNNVPVTWQKGEIPTETKGVMEKVWRNGVERISHDKKKECIKNIRDSFKNIREKAILLCKISSGMDDVDLFNLKIRDYKQGYYDDFGISYIEGYRQKVKSYFQTFFNSEACLIIDLMMKDRERKGEELSDDSWLFVGNKSVGGKYTKMKSGLFAQALREVCEALELNNITSKSFRRWFNTELKRNGIDYEVVERLMGHKFGVSMKYQEMFDDQEAFVEEYSENIEAITLLGNGNVKMQKVSEELERIQTENEEAKTLINDLQKLVKLQNEKMEEMNKKNDDRWTKLVNQGIFED